MMAYEPQPENEYHETSTEMKIATAVFVAVAAWQVADQLRGLSSMAAWDWIILYRAVTIGLFVGGVTYAIVLIAIKLAPGLPALLLQKAEEATGLDLDGKPKPKQDLPTGQPKRERPRRQQPLTIETLPLVEEPTFEETAVTTEAAPDWERRVNEMDYGNGRMLINGQLVELPNGFDLDWIYIVAQKRASGELDTISLRALNDAGISRWGNGGSPASQTLAILEQTGCVQGRGENQPYYWTEGGRKTFPSPTN